MSRCAKCNGKAYDHLTQEQAAALGDVVPAKVLKVVEDYWACQRCKQVYWEGQLFDQTKAQFMSVMADLQEEGLEGKEEKKAEGGEKEEVEKEVAAEGGSL